jgi:hypothetical protein
VGRDKGGILRKSAGIESLVLRHSEYCGKYLPRMAGSAIVLTNPVIEGSGYEWYQNQNRCIDEEVGVIDLI